MLCLPLLQLNVQPEAIDAEGDHRQQKPLDPVAEKLHGSTGELQPATVNDRVLCFPAIDHAHCPGVANAKGTGGDQSAKDLPADQLQQATVKIGFFGLNFHGDTSIIFTWLRSLYEHLAPLSMNSS